MTVKTQQKDSKETERLAALFRQHLEEHHHIATGKDFDDAFIRQHLEGGQTLIPLTIFSRELSPLESVVKYLRENEQARNSRVAELLGRAPAATWITYRNACRKRVKRIEPVTSGLFVPTTAIASAELSALESIANYLNTELGFTYKRIAELLKRDERTIWTVCSRARRKLAR